MPSKKVLDGNKLAVELPEQRREGLGSIIGPRGLDDGTLPVIAGKDFMLFNGDCVSTLSGFADDCIGFSIFSPPFAALYTYTDDPRDMGNCLTTEEFFEHFDFLIPQLLRVTKPGRLCSFHCMNLPLSKSRDGVIGLRDFRGQLIAAFEKHGWVFHSEVTIWKDPVTAMQRTKAIGLLHKQVCKDSALSRQGIADYVVTMRKRGINESPIAGMFTRWYGDGSGPRMTFKRICNLCDGTKESILDHSYCGECDDDGYLSDEKCKVRNSIEVWQRYASPVWMDIDPGDTLQYTHARSEKDERHICLAKGSLVLTRNGYIPIETVAEEDQVLTHMGRWRRVLAVKCNGVRSVVRIKAQGIADLVLTPDHKLWCKIAGPDKWTAKKQAAGKDPEWVNAEDTLSSYLNLKSPSVENSNLTENEWWIIGRWLGDGHVGTKRVGHGHPAYIISCAHGELESLKLKLGFNAGHVATRTASQVALVGLRKEVIAVLGRCGKGAAGKRLPCEAITLCKEKSEALLSGYLSADGHYVEKHDRFMASSVSRALLLGMAIVAKNARGVVASVYRGRGPRVSTIQGREVNCRQDWIFAFRNSEGYRKSGWIDEQGAWKKVRQIESHEPTEVWDIQIEEDQSFTAEGCIVHNCPLQLGVIRRCVQLWSNPSDVVLSPFAGIGSEGVVSLEMERRFIGVELKPEYYKWAASNLTEADKGSQGSLFHDVTITEEDAAYDYR